MGCFSHLCIEVEDQVYAGQAVEPEPTVTLEGATLERGKDYEVSYANNAAPGTATVTVAGKGAYAGTQSATFKVFAGSLSKASVTVANQTYTGKKLKPAPVVKLGSNVLKQGADYTVSYIDNKAAGTAFVVVKGAGDFTDSAFAAFKIGKASQAISAKSVSKKVKASGKTGKLVKNKAFSLKKLAKVSAKTTVKFAKANKVGGKRIAVNASTGKVVVKKGLKKGTYKVKVKLTAKASASYKAAKAKTITLKIVVA